MSRAGWRGRWAAVAMAGVAMAGVTAAVSGPGAGPAGAGAGPAGAGAGPAGAGAGPAGAAPAGGPEVKLIAAQHSITVRSYSGQVSLDPGIWVASLGSALQLDIQRADYAAPLRVTQVVQQPGGGSTQIPWPASVVGTVPAALRHFVHLTVRNTHGKVVAAVTLNFCPDSYDPQRAVPGSPATSPYPQVCSADPFPRGLVWGIAKGWAADPAEAADLQYQLRPGNYTVTESITPAYARLLSITAADDVASVHLRVVQGSGCCGAARGGAAPGGAAPGGAQQEQPRNRPLAARPRVPTLASPPASALPDLVPLPAWGISTSHEPRTKSHPLINLLNFGATVWVGNAPLDVEGFRSGGSPIMPAYQYFWRGGEVIGRVRAGTMGFDTMKGHHHWHFEQFAAYRLLNAARKLVVRSHKVGFCLAPTDPVDVLQPAAVWQPSALGLGDQCGSPTALWVQEMLPPGWGDTYVQSVAGQSFDITSLPDGTYYIEVAANPQGVLHEANTSNDTSFREIILGGTRNHRTVRVPAWNGIDPEG